MHLIDTGLRGSAGDPVAPGWRRVVEPQSAVAAAVTVDELAAFIEDPCPPDDGSTRHTQLEQYTVWATDAAIRYMDRELKQREIVVRFDAYPRAHSTRGRLGRFTGGFEFFATLPRVPIQSIDKVEEFDNDGVAEEIGSDDYDADIVSEPGRIHIDDPPVRGDLAYFAGIRVTCTAGYADADIPDALKLGVLTHAAWLYERRGMDASGSITKSGAAGFYEPYRIRTGL